METIVRASTGEIVAEVKPGDQIKIIREESIEFLKSTVAPNRKDEFIKIYTDILGDLTDENLTGAEYRVILVCLKHLNYYSGAIANSRTGDFITPQSISRETKLSKMTVQRCIDRLTDLKVLHKGRTGKEYQLFANPFIFMRGGRINRTLFDMFKRSKWAKNKAETWQ